MWDTWIHWLYLLAWNDFHFFYEFILLQIVHVLKNLNTFGIQCFCCYSYVYECSSFLWHHCKGIVWHYSLFSYLVLCCYSCLVPNKYLFESIAVFLDITFNIILVCQLIHLEEIYFFKHWLHPRSKMMSANSEHLQK